MDGRSYLERGLTVMENMLPSSTLAEIASRSRLPRSTAHRIVHDLRCHGWLVQNPDATYSPGWRWRAVRGEIASLPELREAVRNELRGLTDATGWSSIFLLHNGGYPRVGISQPANGTRAPEWLTKGALLDERDTAEAIVMKSMIGVEARAGLPIVVDNEERVLARVRARGFALSRREIQTPSGSAISVSIAAAVMDRAAAPLGAVVIHSAGLGISDLEAHDAVSLLRQSAQRLSEKFSQPQSP